MSDKKYIDKNEIKIEGRYTADPVGKVIGGHSLTEFNLAVALYGEKVGFFNVKAWRDAANESIRFKKGNKVIVTGGLGFDSWIDKEQRKRQSIYISASSVVAKVFTSKPDKNIERVDTGIDPFKTVKEDDIPF